MLYFLTVNYYSKELIEKLLQSISHNIKTKYKFVIVNNSPEDSLINEIQNNSIILLESGDNLGFGQGCNLGINYIYKIDRNAFIWLINPDTTLDKDADKYILFCLKNNRNISILGTKIRESKGKIWFSLGHFNKWTGVLKHKALKFNPSQKTPGISFSRWVSGCSLIINLSQFDHCPAFDPHYFLYAEDADLCERYHKQGYFIAVTNKILVTHQVSALIGKDKKFMYSHYIFSRLYFLKQHGTILGLSIYVIYVILKTIVFLPLDFSTATGRWKGLIKFLQNKN